MRVRHCPHISFLVFIKTSKTMSVTQNHAFLTFPRQHIKSIILIVARSVGVLTHTSLGLFTVNGRQEKYKQEMKSSLFFDSLFPRMYTAIPPARAGCTLYMGRAYPWVGLGWVEW